MSDLDYRKMWHEESDLRARFQIALIKIAEWNKDHNTSSDWTNVIIRLAQEALNPADLNSEPHSRSQAIRFAVQRGDPVPSFDKENPDKAEQGKRK